MTTANDNHSTKCPVDPKKYNDRYEAIFGSKEKKTEFYTKVLQEAKDEQLKMIKDAGK